MSTKKVPCTVAAAGAPWTSFVAAVDEVARALPETDISGYLVFPGYGFPDQITSALAHAMRLEVRSASALSRLGAAQVLASPSSTMRYAKVCAADSCLGAVLLLTPLTASMRHAVRRAVPPPSSPPPSLSGELLPPSSSSPCPCPCRSGPRPHPHLCLRPRLRLCSACAC